MNPSMYTSAMEGNLDFLRQHINQLDGELTPNHNTVLHVAAQFGHLDYVKEVLEACPSLLRRPNVKGETPLHTAAREGRAEIVKAMIARVKILEEELESGLVGAVKEMLRATNVDGDTALHMAARNCHFERASYLTVVKSFTEGLECWGLGGEEVEKIVRAAKIDIEQVEETMSIKEVNREKVEEIMRATKEVEEIMRATKVDRDTGMHTAARNRFVKENRDTYLEVVKLLSEEDTEFQHPANNFQETPLYLAAERGIMGVAIVDTLVETYKSLLTCSGPGGRTALHAAALKDSTGQCTKKLLEWKKDLINQADAHGWTPLHYATCNASGKGVKELLAMDISVTYITNTNEDGLETALHIAAAHGHDDIILDSEIRGGRNIACNLAQLEKARRVAKLKRGEAKKQSDQAFKERLEAGNQRDHEAATTWYQTLMVVATLIATITFAAAYAIPGGYDGNQGRDQGMAVLARATAFQAFVITNTIAIICSVISMLLCITGLWYAYRGGNDTDDDRAFARNAGADKEPVYAAAINSSTMLCKVSEDKELVFCRVFAD
ncbi:hypothetical protein RHGRI_012158 [Rhododendron griersonianum]|uniref:PGG domain-containing protein n=1 Tax=Rhododendron griersonianum TaxID=479676 RepID=A0AAV6KPE6_9ERIC|nr:hypothetical protein RHGRI_012158 [Rhododendron griersonianum]